MSASRDGSVFVWDTTNWTVKLSLSPQLSPVSCVRFSADGSLLAVATGSWMLAEPGRVIVWKTADWRHHVTLACDSPIGAVTFSASEKLLVGQWNGQITVWDITSEDKLKTVVVEKDVISAAAFSADCRALSEIDVDSPTSASFFNSTAGFVDRRQRIEDQTPATVDRSE